MKVELKIDPELKRPRVVVYAPAVTPEVETLVQRLEREGTDPFFAAFREGEAVLLSRPEILRFFADGKGRNGKKGANFRRNPVD